MKKSTKKLIVAFLVIIALVIAFFWFIVYSPSVNELWRTAAVNQHEAKYLAKAEKIKTAFNTQLNKFSDEALSLAQLDSLQKFINSQPGTIEYDNFRQKLTVQFYELSLDDPLLMQVRFIENTGKEMVRVDRDDEEDTPIIIPYGQLQDKKHRTYFINGIKLDFGQIYVSDLDLNIENKQIEYPYNPTFRLVTPVFDFNGNKKGIITLNILANKMLDQIKENFDEDYVLLDKDLYYLYKQSTSKKIWTDRYLNINSQHNDLLIHLDDIDDLDNCSILSYADGSGEVVCKIYYNPLSQDDYWLIAFASEPVNLATLFFLTDMPAILKLLPFLLLILIGLIIYSSSISRATHTERQHD